MHTNIRMDARIGILAGFAVAIAAVMYTAHIAYRNAENMVEADRQTAHVNEVRAELQRTLAAVTQSETSQRGFTITGDEAYLAQYQEAEAKLRVHFRQVKALTADNPSQLVRVASLEQAIQQKLMWQSHVLEVRQAQGKTAAFREVASGKGRAYMEEVHRIAGEMERDEIGWLNARRLESEVVASRTLRMVTLFSYMVVVLLLCACVLALRDLRLREGVRRQLLETQRQLRDALQTEADSARVDPLTGLANRRAFVEALESELSRCKRNPRPVTLAYVDLDDFKLINDRYGHTEGDAMLLRVAGVLRQNVRRSDVVARIGGDEFVLLFTETALSGAEAALQNIRSKLAVALLGEEQVLTVSVGSVTFLDAEISVADMLLAADRLMYDVKHNGKNGVAARVFEELPRLAMAAGAGSAMRR